MSITEELLGLGVPKQTSKPPPDVASITDEILGLSRPRPMEHKGADVPKGAISDPTKSAGVPRAFAGGLPTEKQEAIKYFARQRGIPESKYKIIDGNIAYLADDGKYYKEIATPLETTAYYAPDVLEAIPPTVAGIAAAPLSPAVNIPLATTVGGGSNYLRQLIAEQVTGAPINPTDVALSGLLSGVFESVPAIARGLRERSLVRDVGQIDTKSLQNLLKQSSQFGVQLTPAELTQLSSLASQQKVIGNLPTSAKPMQQFYEKREVEQIQPAIDKFLTSISKVTEPTQAGQLGQKALTTTKETLEQARTEATDPLYTEAFRLSKPVDITSVVENIDNQLKTAKGAQAATLSKIKSLMYKEAPRLDDNGNIISKGVLDDRLPALQNTKFNIDSIFKEDTFGSLDKRIQGQIKKIQDDLLTAMGKENPAYLEANKVFADLSKPLEEFAERKTGTSLTQMSSDNLNQFAKRVFEGGSPETVAYVKEQIIKSNPEAWSAVTRAYLQDAWETASKASTQQKGRVKLDVGNAWQNILLGDVKRQKALQIALEPQQFQALRDLSDVLQAAGSVKKLGSDTTFNSMILKQMYREAEQDPVGMAATLIGTGIQPQNWGQKVSEWAAERSLAKDAEKIANIITDPQGINKLKELRQLSPTSAKRWAGTAQILGNYGIIEMKD